MGGTASAMERAGSSAEGGAGGGAGFGRAGIAAVGLATTPTNFPGMHAIRRSADGSGGGGEAAAAPPEALTQVCIGSSEADQKSCLVALPPAVHAHANGGGDLQCWLTNLHARCHYFVPMWCHRSLWTALQPLSSKSSLMRKPAPIGPGARRSICRNPLLCLPTPVCEEMCVLTCCNPPSQTEW